MDGTWRRGGVSGDHFGIIVLAIRDAGDEISEPPAAPRLAISSSATGGSQEWTFQRTSLSEFEACQGAQP